MNPLRCFFAVGAFVCALAPAHAAHVAHTYEPLITGASTRAFAAHPVRSTWEHGGGRASHPLWHGASIRHDRFGFPGSAWTGFSPFGPHGSWGWHAHGRVGDLLASFAHLFAHGGGTTLDHDWSGFRWAGFFDGEPFGDDRLVRGFRYAAAGAAATFFDDGSATVFAYEWKIGAFHVAPVPLPPALALLAAGLGALALAGWRGVRRRG
jgi:hypothetical protein